MKWFGILAFLFIISALGGIVYLGANTDKITFGFGEPNYISKQTESTAPPFVYDCDKNYKKYLKLFDYVDPQESIASQSPERMAIHELEHELIKNGCL